MAVSRIQRWAIIMWAYEYNLTHKFRKENSNTDCLSRSPAEHEKEQFSLKNEAFITDLVNSPVTCKYVKEKLIKTMFLVAL